MTKDSGVLACGPFERVVRAVLRKDLRDTRGRGIVNVGGICEFGLINLEGRLWYIDVDRINC